MGINFEKKKKFCTNATYATKIKTLLFHSEEYQDMRLPKKEIIYMFSSIAILHSVGTIDAEYYPQAYMEEYKYKRIEEVSHINSDSDCDFEE